MRPFERYHKILKNESEAKYLLVKKIPAQEPENLEGALAGHEKGMEELRELWKKPKRETGKIPNAGFSLLDLKIFIAEKSVESCMLCERKCRVNRKKELGFCRVGYESRIASMFEHSGEEDVLVPSGTIFFSGCNWKCVYCQNWNISQFPEHGDAMGDWVDGWIERKFREGRIKNVNLVGGEPTPNLHNILKMLKRLNANVPIVWNSNMYMSEGAMKLLEGVVDIYLADFRYGNDECAMRYSSAPDYMKTAERNFLLAKNGEMLIRVLLLPGHIDCCAKNILGWIGKNLKEKYVNLMSQYTPCYKAKEYPGMGRGINSEEHEKAVKMLRASGIQNYEIQPYF